MRKQLRVNGSLEAGSRTNTRLGLGCAGEVEGAIWDRQAGPRRARCTEVCHHNTSTHGPCQLPARMPRVRLANVPRVMEWQKGSRSAEEMGAGFGSRSSSTGRRGPLRHRRRRWPAWLWHRPRARIGGGSSPRSAICLLMQGGMAFQVLGLVLGNSFIRPRRTHPVLVRACLKLWMSANRSSGKSESARRMASSALTGRSGLADRGGMG